MEFVRRRKIWYILSLLIIIPGLISFALQGLNLGIDFKGGNLLDIEFSQVVTSSELRAATEELKVTAQIQAAGENEFILRTTELTEEQSKAFIKGLTDKFGQLKVHRNEKVSGTIGKELTMKAIYALAIASVLMIIYITFRFEFYFGIAAVLALLHDVFVTIGIFSLFRIEVDSAFVAALLTIIGYSINDTIVIFDRIRENLRHSKKEAIEDVVNASINQTLFRSIATVLTVIIGLVAILVFGGETTRVFALAMLVGTISGAYSSIFTASPLWIDLRKMAENKKRAHAATAK
ncbi:protein translocase subunit SecF [Zhaonella formicivorans]|uniref:protein translocase subunit SecF n=1 Tax=Zhaonella formicivorans TaxID=2528593 RepID=UPI001D128FFC|nr:protein translocase subunit SecF [Zhaonella formicivorans]